MKIYLAGEMKSGWQDLFAAQAKPDWELIDPRSSGLTEPADYTKWDLDGVRRCDVVVAFMSPNNPSGFGMSLEVGFAHALGKRVIFVDGLRDDWRTRYFDMHRQISEVVANFGNAAAAIRRAPDPVLDEGRCVAAHMGGSRCVERCMCPSDCTERPLAPLAQSRC